jgi:hypothetical protein
MELISGKEEIVKRTTKAVLMSNGELRFLNKIVGGVGGGEEEKEERES